MIRGVLATWIPKVITFRVECKQGLGWVGGFEN